MLNLKQIKIRVEDDSLPNLKNKIGSILKLGVSSILDLDILKKSIDARDKNQIYYIYECNFSTKNEEKVLKCNKNNSNLSVSKDLSYVFPKNGNLGLNKNIVVVGSGPAGLFCSYVLLENGYKPIIIERGKSIDERVSDVEEFWKSGVLNTNSNVLFGEGGAGTFSDGKLNTLVKDKENRCKKVFELCTFGNSWRKHLRCVSWGKVVPICDSGCI